MSDSRTVGPTIHLADWKEVPGSIRAAAVEMCDLAEHGRITFDSARDALLSVECLMDDLRELSALRFENQRLREQREIAERAADSLAVNAKRSEQAYSEIHDKQVQEIVDLQEHRSINDYHECEFAYYSDQCDRLEGELSALRQRVGELGEMLLGCKERLMESDKRLGFAITCLRRNYAPSDILPLIEDDEADGTEHSRFMLKLIELTDHRHAIIKRPLAAPTPGREGT